MGRTIVPPEITQQQISLSTSIIPTEGENKNTRKQQSSTTARYKRLIEFVDFFEKIEYKNRVKAMQLAAEKEGCSFDTVERALGHRR